MYLKKILSDSNRKPNKIWVDQGSEFYSKSFKDFLKMNSIEMYSTFNEGKSVVAERFIRTLKNIKVLINIHIDNKKKAILILGLGPTQELGEDLLTAEKCILLISQ